MHMSFDYKYSLRSVRTATSTSIDTTRVSLKRTLSLSLSLSLEGLMVAGDETIRELKR